MEYLANITPLGLAAIALSGILAWVQWLAKKDLAVIQSQFENQQSENQRMLKQLENDRAQLTANHGLYDKLIDTMNAGNKSADRRDEEHNVVLRELSKSIADLGTETRNGNEKQLQVLIAVKEAMSLQSDGIKAVINSNGAILDKLVQQDNVINGHAEKINIGINKLDAEISNRFTRIEDFLKSMQEGLKHDRKLDDGRIQTMMNDINYIKDNLPKTTE